MIIEDNDYNFDDYDDREQIEANCKADKNYRHAIEDNYRNNLVGFHKYIIAIFIIINFGLSIYLVYILFFSAIPMINQFKNRK